jgi:hypothetical protein
MNKGVFSLTCVAGGRFQDAIFGKSFRVCIEFPQGKLSSIGGYFFSFDQSLYTFRGASAAGGGGEFERSETCVHKKYSEKIIHRATQSVSPLQKRLGIIATDVKNASDDKIRKNLRFHDS